MAALTYLLCSILTLAANYKPSTDPSQNVEPGIDPSVGYPEEDRNIPGVDPVTRYPFSLEEPDHDILEVDPDETIWAEQDPDIQETTLYYGCRSSSVCDRECKKRGYKRGMCMPPRPLMKCDCFN
ncbi:unnamed protein product [Larinioides sclopetarius]|uniref:Defensin n=1 Tax=Larinioides sclopetarius TaxID=280406 RepID=A0AAV2BCG6_9ARAC